MNPKWINLTGTTLWLVGPAGEEQLVEPDPVWTLTPRVTVRVLAVETARGVGLRLVQSEFRPDCNGIVGDIRFLYPGALLIGTPQTAQQWPGQVVAPVLAYHRADGTPVYRADLFDSYGFPPPLESPVTRERDERDPSAIREDAQPCQRPDEQDLDKNTRGAALWIR